MLVNVTPEPTHEQGILFYPASWWIVGNPGVICKQALGNRPDGFRSCLTRFPRV